MFCPKCGIENANEVETCTSCGYVFSAANEASTETENVNTVNTVQLPKTENLSKKKILGIAMWIIALLVLILAFVAASNIIKGGVEISSIQSVGGKTLEEAYYQELGTVYKGYAGIVRAFGIFMASVLAYFGFNSFNDGE